jgi:hypothetical protein
MKISHITSFPTLLRNNTKDSKRLLILYGFSKEPKNHQGPLSSAHKDYKGSSYNVLVEWKDGSETYEPLDIIIKDDPVSVASYALENNLWILQDGNA